jgi:hypothetical protein
MSGELSNWESLLSLPQSATAGGYFAQAVELDFH